MKPVGPTQADVLPESVTWKNPGGDVVVQPIAFRCKGCGIGVKTVVTPETPLVAKYRCRRCDYEMEVTTRDSVYETIDGHIEEGAHQAKMRSRSSNSSVRPGMVPAVIRGRLVYVPKQGR